MTITTALLLSTLAAEAAPPQAAPAPPPPGSSSPATATAKAPAPAKQPRRVPAPVASLPTVEGELLEIDHRAHRLRLGTAAGELVLTFDRNTLVLAPGGATTPLQLSAGSRIRAGREGEARAAWVEVKAPPSTPGVSP